MKQCYCVDIVFQNGWPCYSQLMEQRYFVFFCVCFRINGLATDMSENNVVALCVFQNEWTNATHSSQSGCIVCVFQDEWTNATDILGHNVIALYSQLTEQSCCVCAFQNRPPCPSHLVERCCCLLQVGRQATPYRGWVWICLSRGKGK